MAVHILGLLLRKKKSYHTPIHLWTVSRILSIYHLFCNSRTSPKEPILKFGWHPLLLFSFRIHICRSNLFTNTFLLLLLFPHHFLLVQFPSSVFILVAKRICTRRARVDPHCTLGNLDQNCSRVRVVDPHESIHPGYLCCIPFPFIAFTRVEKARKVRGNERGKRDFFGFLRYPLCFIKFSSFFSFFYYLFLLPFCPCLRALNGGTLVHAHVQHSFRTPHTKFNSITIVRSSRKEEE